MSRSRFLRVIPLAILATHPASAQRVDYHKADLIRTSSDFVLGAQVDPTWFADSIRFYYRSTDALDYGVFYVVDPRTRSRRPLFDNARIASSLSIAADTIIDPSKLPSGTLVNDDRSIEFALRKKPYWCELTTQVCALADTARVFASNLRRGPPWSARSPDGKWDVFSWGYNLYLRPATVTDSEVVAKHDSAARAGREEKADRMSGHAKPDTVQKSPSVKGDSVALPTGSIPLTTDGVQFWEYGYEARHIAADTGKFEPHKVSVKWSPDSKRFVVFRFDVRHVRRYPLYSSTGNHPEDRSYVFAAPGDSIVPQHDTYIFDVAARTGVKLHNPPIPDVVNGMTALALAVKWGRGSDELFMLDAIRGSKRVRALLINATTGAVVRTIARDSLPTYVELAPGGLGANWRVVNGGEDVLWYSERDGWAHLYRFANDGTLKNQITRGAYAVRRIEWVDSVANQVYFTAWGREPGIPYYARLYRVNFDGSGLTLLTPEVGNHDITFVPKAKYFIDRYSRVDLPPVTTLRDADGRVLMELAKGDAHLLRAIGWTPAEVFTVKARDGVTDLYGLMYKPSDFDSTKSYPIIANIYPGPQVGSVRDWGFHTGSSDNVGNVRALAELGFIVIQLDALGTPGRSKAFEDFYYGRIGDNGIPDHIAAIRQLAARCRWIDINRVGIYGHSGGGFAAADAILRYPDFFQVAVASSGNHDNRTFGYYWGEQYQGYYKKAGTKDNYQDEANYTLAPNLKGHLLLIHGGVDDIVHPASTLRLVDALIKANKDFDMLIVPDAGHLLPDYTIRKTWDYFVRYLLGVDPPKQYVMIQTNSYALQK
jgi:dipeptidyl aminopeptidase/acylaminoacyl peptidase